MNHVKKEDWNNVAKTNTINNKKKLSKTYSMNSFWWTIFECQAIFKILHKEKFSKTEIFVKSQN